MSADTAPAALAAPTAPVAEAEAPSWTPAFPGQRPPFTEGNTAALLSGTHSPRVYEPLGQQLVAGLLAEHPELAAPRYAGAVAVWGTLMARFQLEALRCSEDGGRSDSWLLRLGSAVQRAGAALGLDPMSEAKLHQAQAATAALVSQVDLGALAARGRAALAAREGAPLPDAAALALDAVRGAAAGQLPAPALDPTAPDELARAAAAVELRTSTPNATSTTDREDTAHA